MTTLTLNRLRNALLVALLAVLVPMFYHSAVTSALWAFACLATALLVHVNRIRGPQFPPHVRHPAMSLDDFAVRHPIQSALLWGGVPAAAANAILAVCFSGRLL